MRDRKDFIENLRMAQVHVMILLEDIKYPLSEERQKLLEGAYACLYHLTNQEMADDIEKAALKLGDYDRLPKRGKETAAGEKIVNHKECGGRMYMAYLENAWYAPYCEKCGELTSYTADSMDDAIRAWNAGGMKPKVVANDDKTQHTK